MDLVFSGRLFTVYQIALFVLEVNYPDFFDLLAGDIGKRIKRIAASAPEKTASTSDSESSET
jgi:hypothetical protein